jgi:hypothetical protein
VTEASLPLNKAVGLWLPSPSKLEDVWHKQLTREGKGGG